MRFVPIPGELVAILRAHIARYGHAADGRLFRSESGRVLYPSSYRYVWQHARELALTPAQVRSLLARRPYDLPAPRGAPSYPRLSREELGGRFLGLMANPASKD